MRKAPIILATFFIFVTLSRVSNYSASMGDKNLSVAFAIGLGSVIFASSYWTQYQGNTSPNAQEIDAIKSTVKFAWIVLIIATLVDGIFNLADVLIENAPNPSSVIYGITPTLISILLGILQARIDRIPLLRRGSSYKVNKAINRAVLKVIDKIQPDEQPVTTGSKPDEQPVTTGSKPDEQPITIPESYPKNGNSRDKVFALLQVNDHQISSELLAPIVGISSGRVRTLKREILNQNGKSKIY